LVDRRSAGYARGCARNPRCEGFRRPYRTLSGDAWHMTKASRGGERSASFVGTNIMHQKILLAVDGSAASKRAVDEAFRIRSVPDRGARSRSRARLVDHFFAFFHKHIADETWAVPGSVISHDWHVDDIKHKAAAVRRHICERVAQPPQTLARMSRYRRSPSECVGTYRTSAMR